jgi:hypothetical protein
VFELEVVGAQQEGKAGRQMLEINGMGLCVRLLQKQWWPIVHGTRT